MSWIRLILHSLSKLFLFISYFKHLQIAFANIFFFSWKNTEIKKQLRNDIGILFQKQKVLLVPLNDILEYQATVSTINILEKKRSIMYNALILVISCRLHICLIYFIFITVWSTCKIALSQKPCTCTMYLV